MNYTSTRDSALCTGASTAILTGIAPGGGLFVPQQFPQVDMREFYGLTYPQTAQKVLGMFLTDYDPDFLKTATEQTYSTENFGGKALRRMWPGIPMHWSCGTARPARLRIMHCSLCRVCW